MQVLSSNTKHTNFFVKYVCIILFLVSSLNAGEVDNYYAWNNEITDSSKAFNRYINSAIEDALARVNKQWGTPDCQSVAMSIMKKMGSTNYLVKRVGSLNTDLELWAQDNPEIDKIPRQGESLKEYAAHSIYAPGLKIFGVPTKLDVTLNVNGVYFGTDKLSHFLGSGFEYYRKYLKYLDEYSPEMAEALSVKWGVKMENGIIGLQAVGVFSYADLEANFQGLQMAEDFCRADNPKLKLVGKNWVLAKQIDFSDYVNPNWDESFNRSTYTQKRLASVKENVNKFHVYEKSQLQWVQNFLAKYKYRYRNDYESKHFLDSSLSAKLLYTAQHLDRKNLSAKDYYAYANAVDLPLSYEEYLDFSDGLELMSQSDVTLENLHQQ
jgi:hypothetical protein